MAKSSEISVFDPAIVWPAVGSSFAKLDPRVQIRNPVMFVVEIVAILTTLIFARDILLGGSRLGFSFQVILWLWFTLLFANFAEAVAEGRGKATRCAGRAPRPTPSVSRPTARPTRWCPRPVSRSAMSWWSRPATSFRPTAR